MIKKFAASIFVLFAITLAGTGRAAEVSGLYAGEVPVADQSAKLRAEALRRALHQVLVRVSGDRHPEQRAEVAAAIKGAAKLMRQFQYRRVQVTPAGGGDQPPTEELRLWAEFERRAVDGLLRDAGLPIWGHVRPAVLVWLTVPDPAGPRLLAADDPNGDDAILNRGAANRGIPLLAPLMDLDDQTRIRARDVISFNREAIEFASQRYSPDAILVGQVSQVLPTLWEAQWTLLFKDDVVPVRWTSRSDIREFVLEEGMAEMADAVAARFASPGGDTGIGELEIAVDDVNGFLDYARVMKYLRGLDLITKVQLAAASGARATFKLSARGGRDALDEVIALGRVLRPEAAGGPGYRLLP